MALLHFCIFIDRADIDMPQFLQLPPEFCLPARSIISVGCIHSRIIQRLRRTKGKLIVVPQRASHFILPFQRCIAFGIGQCQLTEQQLFLMVSVSNLRAQRGMLLFAFTVLCNQFGSLLLTSGCFLFCLLCQRRFFFHLCQVLLTRLR